MALTINGERISDHSLERELLRLSSGLEMNGPEAGAIDPAQLRSAALHNVIGRTLFLQIAAAHQIHVTAEEVKAELVRRWGVNRSSACDPGSMDSIREDLLLDRLQAELTRHVLRPSRAEVERFYVANQSRYHRPEALEAAHILCGCASADEEEPARNMLMRAEDELRKGKPFAQVANRYSDCKGVGGSVGWITRGTMVQEFEDVVFALSLGARSKIFRTVFGFHIATVTRRRKEGLVPLDEVKLEIAKRMHAESRSSVLQQVLARARAESDIHYADVHDVPDA